MLHDFETSKAYGKRGENFIYQYLMNRPDIINIWDVRADPFYQDKDVDFITENEAGAKHFIEVKTDSYVSGNLFYETISSILSPGDDGCMNKTHADTLFYFYPNLKRLYIFDMRSFHSVMTELLDWFEAKGYGRRVANINMKGNGTFKSKGYIVPLEFFHRMDPKWMSVVDFDVVNI